jgi:hypothetical protein
MTYRTVLFSYSALTVAVAVGTLLVRLSTVDGDGQRGFPLPVVVLLVAFVALGLVNALVVLGSYLEEDRPSAVLAAGGVFLVAALCLAGTPLIVLPAIGGVLLGIIGARGTARP